MPRAWLIALALVTGCEETPARSDGPRADGLADRGVGDGLAADAIPRDARAGEGPRADAPRADAAAPALAPEQYPYDPVKFAFRQPIPGGIPDDPRSAAVVARLDLNSSLVKVSLSADGEVPPVYVVTNGDPLYTTTVGGKAVSFRVPAGAVPGGGADYPLVILDPLHPALGAFTELRLWQATINTAQKTLSANGAGLFHYNNDGKPLNPDGSPSLSVPFQGWGTGSGLSILAGLIRPDEVKQGKIAHALRFAYSACNSTNTFRPPATRTDQPKGCATEDAPSAMEMGMRLQLSATVDCDARTVPGKSATSLETRFLRMICHALQDYGMIMIDGTQPKGLLLMMEGKATASWSSLVGAELYGSYGYLLRDKDTPPDGLTRGPSDGIPWDKLRVLAKSVFP